MTTSTSPLDPAAGARIIDALAGALQAHYVFSDLAQRLAADLQTRQRRGEYNGVTDLAAFCAALTAQLQETSRDKHLRVHCSAESAQVAEPDQALDRGEWDQHIVSRNFGIERVERLTGNIGYLGLTAFYATRIAGPAAVAAMGLLAHTAALIVDLRANGGGEPEMVALLASYLFDEPTHLNDLYVRESESTQQYWTLPYVPGPRFGGTKPVYVLVGPHTASGAEEFAYDLQARGRAVIVGEATAGAAHPGEGFPLDTQVGVFIPTGRAINPVTGTDWEAGGIIPDLAVPVARALVVAHAAALRVFLRQPAAARAGGLGAVLTGNGPAPALYDEAREGLAALEANLARSDASGPEGIASAG